MAKNICPKNSLHLIIAGALGARAKFHRNQPIAEIHPRPRAPMTMVRWKQIFLAQWSWRVTSERIAGHGWGNNRVAQWEAVVLAIVIFSGRFPPPRNSGRGPTCSGRTLSTIRREQRGRGGVSPHLDAVSSSSSSAMGEYRRRRRDINSARRFAVPRPEECLFFCPAAVSSTWKMVLLFRPNDFLVVFVAAVEF